MILIVENLKKTRYRSLFILQTNIPVSIYRFEPSEYIELVEEGQKSQYAKPYEEYLAREADKAKKAEERRRTNLLLNEKMKEPLNGNLALNFLFKNSDIGELIKQKSSGSNDGFIDVSRASITTQSILSAAGEEEEDLLIPPNKVTGYYKKKTKIKIGNINDFINKLCQRSVVQEYLNSEDPEFGGVRKLLADFMNKVKGKILESTNLKNDLPSHMDEIHAYVIQQIHNQMFHRDMPSVAEYNFQLQIERMQKLEPSAYGITANMGVDTHEMRQCWRSAIKELKLIVDAPTPALKLQ